MSGTADVVIVRVYGKWQRVHFFFGFMFSHCGCVGGLFTLRTPCSAVSPHPGPLFVRRLKMRNLVSFSFAFVFSFFDVQLEYSKQIGKLDEGWAKSLSHSCQLCQGQTCALCGDKCLKLEPPVIICHHCNKRVVRGGENPFVSFRFWCFGIALCGFDFCSAFVLFWLFCARLCCLCCVLFCLFVFGLRSIACPLRLCTLCALCGMPCVTGHEWCCICLRVPVNCAVMAVASLLLWSSLKTACAPSLL